MNENRQLVADWNGNNTGSMSVAYIDLTNPTPNAPRMGVGWRCRMVFRTHAATIYRRVWPCHLPYLVNYAKCRIMMRTIRS